MLTLRKNRIIREIFPNLLTQTKTLKLSGLRIAVNTRLLLKDRLEGIGWFTYENLKRITTSHPDDHFYFLFDRPFSEEFIFADNITPIILSPQARHPMLYYIWFQFSVKKLLGDLKPDLFISPDGYMPLDLKCKSLIVFHDLNFEHYPKDVPLFERLYYRTFFPKFAKQANCIVTVSQFSKDDIASIYDVPHERIDVVYNGANEKYAPMSIEQQNIVRGKITDGTPYFYFIGSLHPRKNLPNLFRAFDIFRKSSATKVNLVITGARKWWTKDIESVYNTMSFKDDVIFTGRLPVEKVRDLMASAIALTYVSYFEGFGIPIAEAFKCGTPVITANVTSMPEIAGDAAITVDPFDHFAIAEAMKLIAENPDVRQNLKDKGLQRSELYTWDKSAENLWKSIERVTQE